MILQIRHLKKCCKVAQLPVILNFRQFSFYRFSLRNYSENVFKIKSNKILTLQKLTFSQSQNVPKTIKIKPNRSQYKRLLDLAKKEKWIILAGVACLFISSGITMFVPFSLGKILDIIYSSGSEYEESKAKLDKFCLMLCGIFLLGGMANYARVYLFSNACKYLYG